MIKKKVGLILSMVVVAVFTILNTPAGLKPAIGAARMAMDMEQEYEGYLITAHSKNEHDDPAKITKECLLMPECAASGYGITVRPAASICFISLTKTAKNWPGRSWLKRLEQVES